MSVKFDRTNLSNAGDWLRADNTNLAPSSFAFSISLWVYFHVAIESDPETIWYFGEKGTSDKFLALEAFPDPITDETRVRARMKQGTSELSTSDSGVLDASKWHLVTVVATKDVEGAVVLTLYVDAQSTVSGTGSLGTTTESDYDRFALGRRAGTETTKYPCSFYAEQVAVWDTDLDEQYDHDDMWANKTPPSELTNTPSIGYWVLAGHHRSGLRTSNDSSQSVQNAGDLNNEAGTSKPDMQLSAEANPGPLWSVKTPALLYKTTGSLGTVPSRKPKVAASRTNPNFHFFAKPELYDPWKPPTPEGTHPIWDHPNMNVMARVFYTNVTLDKYSPPNYFGLSGYTPDSYLTQVAKRLADWFEYQGFTDMTGSAGGGLYEGSLYLAGLGNQNAKTGTLGRSKQDSGSGLGMPLEQHPLDEVSAAPGLDDPIYPWAVWFRAKGEALVKEYSEEFWPLLKAEFDRRDLAYPKRLHWDFESESGLEMKYVVHSTAA